MKKMVYTMDEGQLLRVWAVICCFGEIREIQDPIVQSEILTNAQILLTAFVLELQPLPGDQTSSATLRADPAQMVKLDA
jgi:hypothetical protein